MSHHVCQSNHIVRYLIHSIRSPNPQPVAQEQLVYETCWGDRVASNFPINPVPSKLHILAKVAGYIFEEVIVCLFTQYNHRKFTHEKITTSIQFFFRPYDLIPPAGDSPLVRIVKTIDQLGGKLEDQSDLLKKLLYSAFAQHIFDPPEFVSHGFDHALNVAHYCEKIYGNPLISSKFEKYHGLGNGHMLGAVKLLAYVHDCGYPHLHGREKANHAVYSADKVDEFRESLQRVLGNSIHDFDHFYSDFRSAVFSHNADDFTHQFGAKQDTSTGHFLLEPVDKETVERVFDQPESGLRPPRNYKRPWYKYAESPDDKFKGRKLDLFYPEDGKLGLQRIPAQLAENPFQMIRIADNLDFVYARVSSFQKTDPYKRLYRIRYDIGVKDTELKKSKVEETQKTRLIKETEGQQEIIQQLNQLKIKIAQLEQEKAELIANCNDLIQQNNDLREVAAKINEKSFKHFGGCEAIIRVENIEFTAGGATTVFVQIDDDLWGQLNSISFEEELEGGKKAPVTIAQYQMFRAWKAFQWIFSGRQSISQGLTFKANGQPVYEPQKTIR